MKESLLVKNFGPITEIEIEIKDINIFIGANYSGKSTVAKLVSIFKSGQFIGATELVEHFRNTLANFNIDFNISQDTHIRYQLDDHYYELKDNKIYTNYTKNDIADFLNPIYIPAERVFFSTLSQSIFGLINSDISLPKWLIDFGAKFEKARSSIKRFPIGFLKANYEFQDGIDFIELPDKTKIRLAQASSGVQSIIPLLLVIQFNTNSAKKGDDLFVIEEPELNLYPTSQKDLIEFIIGRINQSNDKLIITTHSPYLLTSIDNLIQADNVGNYKKQFADEVEKLVSSTLWINFNNVTCYFFNDGSATSTLDEEIKSIGPSNIDDVSLSLGETFENLLTLKYS